MQDKENVEVTRRKIVIGATAGIAAAAAGTAFIASANGAVAQDAAVGSLIDLTGKRALVTGASRGIGAAIAQELANRGADVSITYLQSTDRAAQVVQAIKERGRRGLAIQADSGDPAAVKRSVEDTVKEFGGLDILVNNVGISRLGPFVDLSLADIDALLAVNVRSAAVASQAAIPHLGQGGRIITTGSNAAERGPFPGLAGYAMTKSALQGLTRHLARELGPQGITVNLVQPGPIDTELNPANGGELADLNRQLTAIGRYGTTSDIANLVAFIASPASSFMTGSIVTMDGGYNA
jgi:3-oxoacyl-[acyl-carrier protein] reductase